jgi:antitoxin CcdA
MAASSRPEEHRMRRPAQRSVPKRAANVSVRRDLLEAARAAGVNLSATLERALLEELSELQRRKWREENREAIATYNEHVAKHGTYSDGARRF